MRHLVLQHNQGNSYTKFYQPIYNFNNFFPFYQNKALINSPISNKLNRSSLNSPIPQTYQMANQNVNYIIRTPSPVKKIINNFNYNNNFISGSPMPKTNLINAFSNNFLQVNSDINRHFSKSPSYNFSNNVLHLNTDIIGNISKSPSYNYSNNVLPINTDIIGHASKSPSYNFPNPHNILHVNSYITRQSPKIQNNISFNNNIYPMFFTPRESIEFEANSQRFAKTPEPKKLNFNNFYSNNNNQIYNNYNNINNINSNNIVNNNINNNINIIKNNSNNNSNSNNNIINKNNNIINNNFNSIKNNNNIGNNIGNNITINKNNINNNIPNNYSNNNNINNNIPNNNSNNNNINPSKNYNLNNNNNNNNITKNKPKNINNNININVIKNHNKIINKNPTNINYNVNPFRNNNINNIDYINKINNINNLKSRNLNKIINFNYQNKNPKNSKTALNSKEKQKSNLLNLMTLGNHINGIKNNINLKTQKYNIKPISNQINNQNSNKNSSNNKQTNYFYHSTNILPDINTKLQQNIPPDIRQNHFNIIQIPQNKHPIFGEKGTKKSNLKEIIISKIAPNNKFNPSEFRIVKQIGEGTFGKIYCVQWIKNNELYALKKLKIIGHHELKNIQRRVKIIQNLIKKIGHNGLIKIYGDKFIELSRQNEYNYYIIMELIEVDWDLEIKNRKEKSSYYSEEELLQIIFQLVKTLSLMQKNNVTHRDIKPQNVLVSRGKYKLCDFGDVKIINGDGIIMQPVRGSELYMSPILFYAYNKRVTTVLHNTYKSDVFSLGMCILLASTLTSKTLYNIRELRDINIVSTIVTKALIKRYSQNIIDLIIKMLQIDENLRFDFIELEEYISRIWKVNIYY